jgi:hypothetical protein
MLVRSHPDIPPQVRRRCRNPRCGELLPVATENPRAAFCCQHCHDGFYRERCRVCERPITRKNSRKQICNSRRCEADSRRHQERFVTRWYIPSGVSSKPEKSSTISRAKSAPKIDLRWLDDLFARHRRERAEAIRERNKRCPVSAPLIGPHDPPVNLCGGYKFPNAPEIDLNSPAAAPSPIVPPDSDFLAIPPFLRRALPEKAQ